MKTRTASGLFLALGLALTPVRGEELQWRASTPRPDNVAPAGDSNRAALISRPMPLPEPTPVPHDGAITPVSYRPVRVARTTMDETQYPVLMPRGPLPDNIAQSGSKPAQSESIPFAPKPVVSPSTGTETIIPYTPATGVTHGAACGCEGGDCGGGADCCDCCSDCCCDCCCDCCGCGCCCCYGLPFAGLLGGGGGGLLGAYPINGCMTRQYFWASAELLIWQLSRDSVVPLLTTAPQGTPLDPLTGVAQLGTPGTQVLAGNNALVGPGRTGGRFTLGFWLPFVECWGIEASFLTLGDQTRTFSIASNGDPILARPFVNANNGLQTGFPTAFPGVVTGGMDIRSSSQFWALEINARRKLVCGPGYWADMLIGYRRLQLLESLTVLDLENAVGGPSFLVLDQFKTGNDFDGGQIGFEGQYNFWRRVSIGGYAKFAMGNMRQVLNINGSSNNPDPPAGGFLALQSNIGNFARDRFAVVPNIGLKIGWNPTEHLQFFVGYDMLYVSDVIRVGQQVDGVINPRLFPGNDGQGPRRPAVLFQSADLWAHGVSFGMLYNW